MKKTKEKTDATYAPQNRYRKRNADERGLVRITSWVPADQRERALNYCANLRKKQAKKGAE